MSKPRSCQTEAIIIKKTKLGEADRILTLFTPDLGKIRAVAKGVRRPRSKLSGHLELLTYSTVSLARGRNLDTITGSQTINSFLPLKSDLELSAHALYVAELVDQFTGDEMENAPLFYLLRETMTRLCQRNPGFGRGEVILRYFELQLLNETGYRPQLDECVTCHKEINGNTSNWFSSSAGGVLCSQCVRGESASCSISANALEVLRFLQSTDYDNLFRLQMGPALVKEVKEIVRRYLHYLLEREIKSAAWLDTLKATTEPATPKA